MISRRALVVGTTFALATPYILRRPAIAQTARVRRDVSKLDASDAFFRKYADAVSQMHKLPANDPRNWRNQALIHLNFCHHDPAEFPHWHRHYVANFEAICAHLIGDPEFALPYWNWSANRGRIPDPFYDVNELNVTYWKDVSKAGSPNWGSYVSTIGVRNLAKGQGLQDDPQSGGAFVKSNIDNIQRLTAYSSYSSRLEGSPHNIGHILTGGDSGHMSDGMSPLDPIFWLHHCNVDCLWAQWQAAGNTTPAQNGNYSRQFVDAAGNPVTNATSANALSIANFKYTYDILLPAAASGNLRLDLKPAGKQTVLTSRDLRQSPTAIGVDATQKTAATRVETRFTVQTKALLPNLFAPRTYWATDVLGVPRLAAETGRILAKFSNVMGSEKLAPVVVNVFVNCPYLSPETPYSDQHYAGSFGIFGPQHHQMEMDYFVDVTDPLRKLASDGRIATDNVNVQLMPQPVEKLGLETKLSVGSVELLAA